MPAREGPLTKEEDPQAQQDQGSEETHVEGDAQLPACTLALDLVLHTQGGHGLRSAGLSAPPSPQTLHIHIGVFLAAGVVGLLPDPSWGKGGGQGSKATGEMGQTDWNQRQTQETPSSDHRGRAWRPCPHVPGHQ